MNESLIAGLVGALIGAGASIAGQMIQAYYQAKRDRMKLVVDSAIADHRHAYDHGRTLNRPVELPPLVAFVHYHAGLMDLLEQNMLTPETIAALKKQNEAVVEAIKAYSPGSS